MDEEVDDDLKKALCDRFFGWELVEFLDISIEDIVDLIEENILDNIEEIKEFIYGENNESDDE